MGTLAPQPGDLVVALAQIATCPGQLRHNLAKHLAAVEDARAAGAHLVVFPELSLSGYLLAHGVLEHAMRLDDPRLDPLLKASRDIALLVGLPLREPHGGVSNAAVLLERGEVRGVHRKLYLPTYGMFDEGRYFVPGPRLAPIACALGRFGVLICEDAWHLSSAIILAHAGVDALLVVAGGPTELDCRRRAGRVAPVALDHGRHRGDHRESRSSSRTGAAGRKACCSVAVRGRWTDAGRASPSPLRRSTRPWSWRRFPWRPSREPAP